MNNTFNDCQLVWFTGFYNSVYDDEIDDGIRNAIQFPEDYGYILKKDTTLEYDDFDIRYKEYHDKIVEDYVEHYKQHIPTWIDVKITNPILDSPEFYNYRNDKIYCDFEVSTISLERIADFIENDIDFFKDIIYKNHTSRDGFWSFMPNDVKKWIESLRSKNPDNKILAFSIAYIMLYEDKEIKYKLIYETWQDEYFDEFFTLSDNALREKVNTVNGVSVQEWLKEHNKQQ